MKASEAMTDYLPTFARINHVIEQYQSLLRQSLPDAAAPRVELSALDAYLLQQLVSGFANPVTVCDLAADATLGVSLAVWQATETIQRVIVPAASTNGQTRSENKWRELFSAFAQIVGWDVSADVLSELPLPQALAQQYNPLTSLFFCLAVTESDAAQLTDNLSALFASQPQATVLLLPLGRVGESGLLSEALQYVQHNQAYKLLMLRERSAFWGNSQLGIISLADNPVLELSLNRLTQQYAGNFQFLDLVKRLSQSELRLGEEKAKTKNFIEDLKNALEWATNDSKRTHLALKGTRKEVEDLYRDTENLHKALAQSKEDLAFVCHELDLAKQELQREKALFAAHNETINLGHEFKRWLWRKLPRPLQRLVKKIRRLPPD